MKRRDFLRYGSGAVVGAPMVFTRKNRLFASPATSRIALVIDPRASTLAYTTIEEVITNRLEEEELTGKLVDRLVSYTVDQSYIGPMVDEAIMSLTGKSTVAEAWESLFPEGQLTTETKIAIKINICYGWEVAFSWNTVMSPFGAKAPVLNAVVNGLAQMLDGTFPVTNIRVFDRIVDSATQNNERMVQQGFPASTDEDGRTYLVSGEGQCGIELVDVSSRAEFLETAPTFEAGPAGKTITQSIVPPIYESDFMINLTNMKDHYFAGVTGAFKNLFGCIHNCAAAHSSKEALNSDGCSPADYLPDVYSNINATCPIIVHIMDGLGGLYEGGPTYGRMFSRNLIAASVDPVTFDFYELILINEERRIRGLHDIQTVEAFSTNEDGHVNASYLNLAAVYYSLGNLNLGEQIHMQMVDTVKPMPSLQKPQSRLLALRRSAGRYRIGLSLDSSGRMHTIESRIVTMQGRMVRSTPTIRTRQPFLELEWDGKGSSGSGVARGFYTWEILVDGRVHHQSIAHF